MASKKDTNKPKELLPLIEAALNTGDYDFIAKNAIRIYSLEPFKYQGRIGQKINVIEISWN
jgi:hypothetical protein